MKESWKQRQLDDIFFFHSDLYFEWKALKANDDRAIFCNTYEHLIDAIKSLPENPHVYVRVAMNRLVQEEFKILFDIRDRFT